jgi:hypothetical protein
MDKLFLLTYYSEKEGTTFTWFDTEIELRDFVEDHQVKVIDAIYIRDYEELE